MNLKTLCPLAWNHFSVNLDTSMRICCNTHNGGNILHEDDSMIRLAELQDLESYYNAVSFRNIRRQMMSGERPELCHNCFMNEDHGGRSLREIYLDRFIHDPHFKKQLQETKEDGSITPHVTYLDFSLSNKCNLKCVMCGPSASSILRQDFEALGWDYDKDYYRNADEGWKDEASILRTYELCLPTIKEMLFTGGEPLVAPLHIKLLERAVAIGAAKNIVLRYHSNCTNIPDRLLEIWQEFERIDMHASVEGVGDFNDYIRFGSKFSTVEKNIIRVADIKNVVLEVHTCFQIPTILHLPELHKWVYNLHPRVPQLPYHIWVNHPDWLELYNLRDDLKIKAREQIENSIANINVSHHTEWVSDQLLHLRSLMNRMDSKQGDPNKWHEFKRKISQLESVRGNSLKTLCPDLFS